MQAGCLRRPACRRGVSLTGSGGSCGGSMWAQLQRETPAPVCTRGMDPIPAVGGKNASFSPPALRHLLCKAGMHSLRLAEQGWKIKPSLKLSKLGPSGKEAPPLHVSMTWMSPVVGQGGYFQAGCVVSFN